MKPAHSSLLARTGLSDRDLERLNIDIPVRMDPRYIPIPSRTEYDRRSIKQWGDDGTWGVLLNGNGIDEELIVANRYLQFIKRRDRHLDK